MFPSGKDAPPQWGVGGVCAGGWWRGHRCPEEARHGWPREGLSGANRHFSDQLFGPFYQNIRTGGIDLTCRDWALYSQTPVLLLLRSIARWGPSGPRKQRQNKPKLPEYIYIYMDTEGFTAFVSFLSSNKQIKYMPVHSLKLIKMLALVCTSAVVQINVFVSR